MTATRAKWSAAWLTAVTITLLAPCGHAGLGDLDVRFGSNGRLEVADPYDAQVLLQPDGKLLAVGNLRADWGVDRRSLVLARWLADGRPDPGFGQGGRIVAVYPMIISAAALQPDGKIVLAGAAPFTDPATGANQWVRGVARIDADGQPDPSFGTGGFVNGGDPGPGYSDGFGPDYKGYSLLRVLPGGDILAVVNVGAARFIDRYSPGGRRLASTPLGTGAFVDMAAGSDMAVIVLSRRGNGSVLWRLQPSGEIDRSFGQQGYAEFYGGWDGTMAVEPNGPIFVCDSAGIRAFDAQGHVDTRFGRGRTGFVDFSDVLGSGGSRTCEGIAPSSSTEDAPLVVVARWTGGRLGSPAMLVIGLDRQGLPDERIGSGQGWVATRIGHQYSAGDWRLRSLDFQGRANAILSWDVTVVDEKKTVVESVDLGSDTGRGAVGTPAFEPRLLESAGASVLRIVRSGPAEGAASVRFELVPVTSSPDDTMVTAGSLTWTHGDRTAREISIQAIDDALLEGEETFRLRLFDASGVEVPQEFTTITIVDDDVLRALRFDQTRITWTQGPDVPASAWPRLNLWLDTPVAGPVTAYHYQAEAMSSCCLGRVLWAAGEAGSRNIPISMFVGPGNTFYVTVTDDLSWIEGASTSVEVVAQTQPTSPPPQTGGSPFNPTPNPSGGDGGGGGGALDAAATAAWLALLLSGSARRRRALR